MEFGAGETYDNTVYLEETKQWKGLLMGNTYCSRYGSNNCRKSSNTIKNEFISSENIVDLFKKYKVS